MWRFEEYSFFQKHELNQDEDHISGEQFNYKLL